MLRWRDMPDEARPHGKPVEPGRKVRQGRSLGAQEQPAVNRAAERNVADREAFARGERLPREVRVEHGERL